MLDWFLGCSRQDKASGGEPSKAVEEEQARNEDSEVRKKERGKQREVVEEGSKLLTLSIGSEQA